MKIARIINENDEAVYIAKEGKKAIELEGTPFGGIKRTPVSLSLDSVKQYLPPVEPPNIVAIGLNYRAHARESNSPLPERPVIFLKATTALNAHGGKIILPAIAPDEVDYEAEMAVIIGKRAKNVPVESALDYVLGYTCANDVSARDCQHKLDIQWARGKSFDTFAPAGPWIETEADPDNLRIRSILNGNVMQDSHTSDMIFSTAELLSYISHSMTLLPGTIVLTGTPEGVGAGRKPPVYLEDGDMIEIEIENIGRLTNEVTAN